jgi:serine/threonine protein kinase
MLCVTVVDKSGKARSSLFRKNELFVGRASNNDIRLDPYVDIEVSRRHGVLRHGDDGNWYYEDLGSTQGTFMGTRRLEGPVVLCRGDVLNLGRTGPSLSVTWPVQRITGAEGTHLRVTKRDSPYFPMIFSEGFGDTYDSYERIGTGGFGEIWRAFKDGQPVSHAIKIMHPELLAPDYLREEDRASLVQRFKREARITHALATSGAPGVVMVHRWGDDPDRDFLYIVMDFVEGESLDKTIFRYDPIPEAKACRYLYQVAEALHYSHNFTWNDLEEGKLYSGIIHRDIKPNNILLDLAQDRAMLVDFGIAGIQEGGERLTATSVRVGSHKFLSPEAMEANVISPSLDLWAFAVTAYLLLSRGHFPYKGRDTLELIRNMRERALRPLNLYRQDLHPELLDLIHRSLEIEPQQRPQSAADWMEVLKKYME